MKDDGASSRHFGKGEQLVLMSSMLIAWSFCVGGYDFWELQPVSTRLSWMTRGRATLGSRRFRFRQQRFIGEGHRKVLVVVG